MKYYPFELHCHTCHSDGSFTPEELILAAKQRGLSGIALTDHNTAAGVKEAVEYGKKYGVLVIPGIEWTTFYGHITVLGGHSGINWTTVTKENVVEKNKGSASGGRYCDSGSCLQGRLSGLHGRHERIPAGDFFRFKRLRSRFGGYFAPHQQTSNRRIRKIEKRRLPPCRSLRQGLAQKFKR